MNTNKKQQTPLQTIGRIFFIVTFLIVISAVIPAVFAAVNQINISKLTDRTGGNIQVTSADNTTIMCFGNASGNRNIAAVNATFYGPSSVWNSPPSAGAVYRNTSCTFTAATFTAFNCTATIHHHSEPGTWGCIVFVRDNQGNKNTTINATLDSFMSISVTTAKLNFSKISLGRNTGTTDYPLLFNNTGNVPFRLQMDAYRVTGTAADANCMSCTQGTIPVGSFVYAQAAGVTATSKTPLTDTPITATYVYNDTALGATAYTNWSTYFGLVMPNTSAQGVCTGILSITAVP